MLRLTRFCPAVLLAVVACWGPSAPAGPAADPPAVGPRYVPADAALFVHAEAAKLWTSPVGKAFLKADPKLIDELFAEAKKEFAVTPDQLNSLTLYWPKLKQQQDMQSFGLVLTFTQPYDGDKLTVGLNKLAGPGGKMTLHTPDDKTAVALFGLGEDFAKPRPANEAGPLAAALKDAASGKYVAAAGANLEALPDEIRGDLPPDAEPFAPLAKADTIVGLVGLDKNLTVEVRVKAPTKAAAGEAEKSLGLLANLARQGLTEAGKALGKDFAADPALKDVVALMTAADTAFKDARYTTDGTETRAVVTMPADQPFGGAFVGAVKKVRGSAARVKSSNNLKQIALALHNYHSTYDSFPPAAVVDKDGKPLLSWRVMILPYVEQDALYKQFKLDEPWDSEHNKKLIAKMPNVYALPGHEDPKDPKTYYRVFTGNGAAFDLLTGVKITDFQDGTSNTILVATAAEGVPWTKPDELPFDPEADPTKQFGSQYGDVFVVAFADGSVRAIKKTVKPRTLGQAITRSGGEAFDLDD